MDRTSTLKRRGGWRWPGRQRGVTLLEALAALLIGALVIAGVSRMINVSLNDSRDQQVAAYQEQLAAAVGQAIKLNYQTLLSNVAQGAPSKVYTTADLVANNFIPASFANAKNGFGQSYCLLMQQPVSGQLDALLITTGGTAIPDVDLGYIAANSGVGGGLIGTSQPGSAVGAYGGWNAPLATWNGAGCTGTTGHLANQVFMTGPGNQSTDFLYRVAVPGHPDLNAMNASVPIGLAMAKAGGTCSVLTNTSVPVVADSTTGHLLSCIGGFWTPPSWRVPVSNVAALQTLTDPSNLGDIRVTLDTHLPYLWTGTSWAPLAVDDNGALNFPTVVTQGAACGSGVGGPTQSSDNQIGVTADGTVLTCQSKVWTAWSVIVPGTTDSGCMAIYPSDSATPADYAGCQTSAGSTFSWDVPSQTENNIYDRKVTLYHDGLITATTFAHMNYAICNQTGRLGQLTQYLDIMDSGGNVSYAHTEAQTPNIQDASAGISMTLNQALTGSAAGTVYTVRIRTNWGLFTPAGNGQLPWYSNYCPTGPDTIIYNTPLAMGWSINTVY